MLGASEHQYGEEGPLEDNTRLQESKAESWKEREAGKGEESSQGDSANDIRCDMSRRKPLMD